MSVAIRLGAAVAVLLFGCSRDLSDKTACNTTADCVAGYTCVALQCVPSDGGGIGGGGTGGGGNVGGGTGGIPGTFDGGRDGLPASMCPMSPVNACPADPGSRCAETYCGGRIWQNSLMRSMLVQYKFKDQAFSTSARNAIKASAAAWTRASAGFVMFRECTAVCMGRFITIVPGDGDGIIDPDGMEQLPMPAAESGGRVSPHRIAHQWGHALGLSHTYERADRDRYLGFNPDVWCPPGGSGLPPHCAAGPAGPPGFPAVTTGTFGVFDGKSKMNGLRSEGICGAEEPDEDSGEPTIGDVSALAELLFGVTSAWSPFRPIGRSVSPTQPLDYQLAPGVDPTGSPQIVEATYASPEIFVRGTDGRVYATARSASTEQWLDWAPVADDVDADPAVAFAWLEKNPEILFLAVRSQSDAQIHLRARRDGYWGEWTSLGAPPAGAASAPALASASASQSSLAVLVRGGDGLIYHLACTDALEDCAASAAPPGAWSALPAPSTSGIFVGKPSAIWPLDNTGLTVAAIRDDRVAMYITHVDSGASGWLPADNITADLAPDDPDPGVAIATTANPGDLNFFARNQQGLLAGDTLSMRWFSIGGVLASPPGVVTFHVGIRTDVAAIIDDHGHPGVWWRYNDLDYTNPCYYNSPAACLQCGLDPP